MNDLPAFPLSGASGGLLKRPRKPSVAHLAWIRRLACLVSGARPVEAAHIRFGSIWHGKPHSGIAAKPSDCWVTPLAPDQHRRQHSMNERAFWKEAGIDPIIIAALLYAVSGDDEAGELIIRGARSTAPWRD